MKEDADTGSLGRLLDADKEKGVVNKWSDPWSLVLISPSISIIPSLRIRVCASPPRLDNVNTGCLCLSSLLYHPTSAKHTQTIKRAAIILRNDLDQFPGM